MDQHPQKGPCYTLDDLLLLMSRLRDPVDGCPWDRAQNFSSIVPHTIEECYELADAIENTNENQIKEELGDLLFQVVFYAQLASEKQQFTFSEVVASLVEKLLRRHPHVFPDGTLQSRASKMSVATEEISSSWDKIKKEERHGKHQYSITDDVPLALPALTRSLKLQKRVAKVGFDFEDIDGALKSLQSEISELIEAGRDHGIAELEEELGDVIFSSVNVARFLKIDPESILRKTNKKFENRFRYIEEQLLAAGNSLDNADIELMDRYWDEAKTKGL
ncbi:MAG: ATP diphosphatase [Oceanicoccus sp.]|jgi:ATP diphosphatase